MARRSALFLTALLCFSAALTTSSAFAHEYPSNHDDATGGFELPITARIHVLFKTLNCFAPQPMPARSEPLIANGDVILFCGERDRIAAAQIVADPSRPLDFVMDFQNDVVSDPLFVLKNCIVVVTFPGGSCSAHLSLIGNLADYLFGNLLGINDHSYDRNNDHNYYRNAPVYEATNFQRNY